MIPEFRAGTGRAGHRHVGLLLSSLVPKWRCGRLVRAVARAVEPRWKRLKEPGALWLDDPSPRGPRSRSLSIRA